MVIKIITYQDLETKRNHGATDQEIMQFVRDVIKSHKESKLYADGWTANEYANQRNVKAVKREKLYRDIAGRLTKNEWTPCHRMKTNLFDILATGETSYSLGNGVTLQEPQNKEKLGDDFDKKLYQAGYNSITQVVAYLFWNYDHVEIFENLEFAPLQDEKTSSLRAGVRWWQIDDNKPLRATLYEEDGYTEYVWRLKKDGKINEDGEVLQPKRGYQITVSKQANEETEITNQQNYPSFPIVPLWSNTKHSSQFSGIQDTIDTIDELTNSLNDDLTENQLYWLIQGADGMDKYDLAKFLDELRSNKIVNPAEGQTVQPYTVNIPVAERQSEIARLKRQVYEDFQGLDIDEIKGGAVTATQIKAAYEPMSHKADNFEMCVIECLQRLFKLIPGLEDEKPTFTRSAIINQTEMIQAVNQSAQYIGAPKYITKKLLTILGDADQFDDIVAEQEQAEMERAALLQQQMQAQNESTENTEDTEDTEKGENEIG